MFNAPGSTRGGGQNNIRHVIFVHEGAPEYNKE